MYNLYNVAKDSKLTPQQKHVPDQLRIAFEQSEALRKSVLAAIGAETPAALAEFAQYNMSEVLHALRTTYGTKPDPTRRLELLHDINGKLPEYASVQKAAQYARVTPRRIRELMSLGRLHYVGGKGHRRVLVAGRKDHFERLGLIDYYPPEK